jgi:hypothetical protein
MCPFATFVLQSIADKRQNVESERALMAEWLSKDFESAVNWQFAWIEGDIPAAEQYLETAVQHKAMNSTMANEIQASMRRVVLPLQNWYLIKNMGVAERLDLMTSIANSM